MYLFCLSYNVPSKVHFDDVCYAGSSYHAYGLTEEKMKKKSVQNIFFMTTPKYCSAKGTTSCVQSACLTCIHYHTLYVCLYLKGINRNILALLQSEPVCQRNGFDLYFWLRSVQKYNVDIFCIAVSIRWASLLSQKDKQTKEIPFLSLWEWVKNM